MKLDRASILIKKSSLEFDRIANNMLKEYGLTAAQCKVLIYVYEEENVRIVDLERFYSMSHATMIGVVRNLEKKGLIEYRRNPEDARSRFIVPSELALEHRDELEVVRDNLEKELTRNLTAEEYMSLIRLMMKLMGIEEQ